MKYQFPLWIALGLLLLPGCKPPPEGYSSTTAAGVTAAGVTTTSPQPAEEPQPATETPATIEEPAPEEPAPVAEQPAPNGEAVNAAIARVEELGGSVERDESGTVVGVTLPDEASQTTTT